MQQRPGCWLMLRRSVNSRAGDKARELCSWHETTRPSQQIDISACHGGGTWSGRENGCSYRRLLVLSVTAQIATDSLVRWPRVVWRNVEAPIRQHHCPPCCAG